MLTDKQVRALRTQQEREDVFDGEGGIAGFGVRVWGRTGKKSFFLMYRTPSAGKARDRKVRRLDLGHYGLEAPAISLARARQRARAALGDLAKGVDPGPATERPQASDRTAVAGRLVAFLPDGFLPASFGQLVAEYLQHHAWIRKKDPVPDERAMRYKLLPRWSDVPLAEIDRRTVIAYLDEARVTAGPVAANRLQALLSKMFNFGLQRDLVSFNPVVGISKNKETPKDRYLNERELRTLLQKLHGDGGDAAYQVAKLILLTGMRPGEAMHMAWADFDGDEWYNLRAAHSKNGVASRVYLSEPARAVIAERRLRKDGSPYVFSGSPGRPLASIRKPLLEVRQATGINFTPHDLRRTCATHIARLGFSDLVPEILNHKPRGVTSIYNRYRFDKEKRQALATWAEELTRISSEEAASSPELVAGVVSAGE